MSRAIVLTWLFPVLALSMASCTPRPVYLGWQPGPPHPPVEDPPRGTRVPASGRDYAILIGVSRYDHWADLAHPVPDIQAIGRELEEIYGFAVDRLVNPTKAEILDKLREYGRRAFAPQDQLLIMFAGHGTFHKDSATGYFVARDSKSSLNRAARKTLLEYPIALIDEIPSRHILLVVDSCYSGTLDPRIAYRGGEIHASPSNAGYFRRKMELLTRQYITSGGRERVPDESPFAKAVLEGLRSFGGGNGILTLNELIVNHLEKVQPLPRWGPFSPRNDPSSTFLFIVKSRRRALDDVSLPANIAEAEGFCRVGGMANYEKSVQRFRRILDSLQRHELSQLDSDLLDRARAEYLSGSPERACLLYRALFQGFYGSATTQIREGEQR